MRREANPRLSNWNLGPGICEINSAIVRLMIKIAISGAEDFVIVVSEVENGSRRNRWKGFIVEITVILVMTMIGRERGV